MPAWYPMTHVPVARPVGLLVQDGRPRPAGERLASQGTAERDSFGWFVET